MKIASLNLRMYLNFHIHKLKCIIENEFEGKPWYSMVSQTADDGHNLWTWTDLLFICY